MICVCVWKVQKGIGEHVLFVVLKTQNNNKHEGIALCVQVLLCEKAIFSKRVLQPHKAVEALFVHTFQASKNKERNFAFGMFRYILFRRILITNHYLIQPRLKFTIFETFSGKSNHLESRWITWNDRARYTFYSWPCIIFLGNDLKDSWYAYISTHLLRSAATHLLSQSEFSTHSE